VKCYPQGAYPYGDLVETNRRRSRQDFEYELLDTGVFDQDRYFDVFVEYAKAAPEDILIQITVCNRGPEPATLHVLPTLWFRNTWSWGGEATRPTLRQSAPRGNRRLAPRTQRALSLVRGRRGATLHGKRNQCRAHFWQAQPDAIRQRWNQRVPGARPPRRREPCADGDEGLRPLSAHHRRRGDAYDPFAAMRRITSQRVRKRLRSHDANAPTGGRSVLRVGHPGSTRCRHGPRSPPGARRHAVEQAVLFFLMWISGSKRLGLTRFGPSSAPPAMSTGTI